MPKVNETTTCKVRIFAEPNKCLLACSNKETPRPCLHPCPFCPKKIGVLLAGKKKIKSSICRLYAGNRKISYMLLVFLKMEVGGGDWCGRWDFSSSMYEYRICGKVA